MLGKEQIAETAGRMDYSVIIFDSEVKIAPMIIRVGLGGGVEQSLFPCEMRDHQALVMCVRILDLRLHSRVHFSNHTTRDAKQKKTMNTLP
jgi:hypothetical protein